MQLITILFLSVLVLCIKGLLIYFFSFNSFTVYIHFLGQTTQISNYYCNENNTTVGFTTSRGSHSAQQLISSCSLQQCNVRSNYNASCYSSARVCFDYRTFNNSQYCAPGVLCSLLEPCNTINYTCASSTSICVINSCCTPQAVCLPLLLTNFCVSGNATVKSMIVCHIVLQSI